MTGPAERRWETLAKALHARGDAPTIEQARTAVLLDAPSLAAEIRAEQRGPAPVVKRSPTLDQIQRAARDAVRKGLAPTEEQAVANILDADPALWADYRADREGR